MKPIAACLLAAALLLALPQASRADQFTQIQNSPNTYWVPSSASTASSKPTNKNSAHGYPAAPPQYYANGPGPYYYGPPPGYYYAGPGPYYYAPPPPPPGPPVRIFIGVPGLFFGFHVH